MDKLKLPVALVIAICAQGAAAVWWISDQANTIQSLEETVSQLGSRMAIEDTVNTKRDVEENGKSIVSIWEETDEIWEEIDALSMSIQTINNIKRIATIETEIKYLGRDPRLSGPMVDLFRRWER